MDGLGHQLLATPAGAADEEVGIGLGEEEDPGPKRPSLRALSHQPVGVCLTEGKVGIAMSRAQWALPQGPKGTQKEVLPLEFKDIPWPHKGLGDNLAIHQQGATANVFNLKSPSPSPPYSKLTTGHPGRLSRARRADP